AQHLTRERASTSVLPRICALSVVACRQPSSPTSKGVLLMTTSIRPNLVSPRARVLVGAIALLGVGVAGAAIITSSGNREATIPAGTVVVAALEHSITTRDAAVG